jgi:methyl-accepting chemotaxis protein
LEVKLSNLSGWRKARQKEGRMKRGEKKQRKRKSVTGVGFFRSIQFKLIASFLVPVICIVILGVVSYQKASSAVTRSYTSSVEQTMGMMGDYLTLAVDTVQNTYKSYLNDDSMKSYFMGTLSGADGEVFSRRTATELKGSVTADSMISNIFFLSDKQEPITTTSIAGQEAYESFISSIQGQMAKNDANGYFLFGNQSATDELLKTENSKYSMRLVKRMVNTNSYMMVDLSYGLLRDSLISLDVGEDGYVGLITCDGAEFVTENGSVIAPETAVFTDKEFYERALAASEDTGAEEVEYQGEKYMFLYQKMGKSAMIAVLIPNRLLLAQAADIKQLTMIISILAAVVALVLGTVISQSFSGTIRSLVKRLKRVADGDLTVEVHSKRKDEFRVLSDGIASMIHNMKKLITDITEASEELTGAAVQVSDSSNMFMQTSRNIQLSISEIEKGVTRLDTDSADCLNQMDGLSGKITSVSDNASEISQLTAAAGGCIVEGMQSMEGLTESAKSTTRITAEVITAIEALEEKSRSIGNIIEAINEIASQTNLLSLNASIEAARAGEAGKGFAVVAEEIRKLADQSLMSANQIGEIIDEMISNTVDVVDIAKQAESVVASQEGAVESTTRSFQEIDKQVSRLMEALQMISDSVDNMDSDRSATLGSIESISAVSAQAAASSQEVYATADKQLAAITKLETASGQLQKRASQLRESLQQFTL